MSEPQVFNLPDVGEGLTEAEIVVWHVKTGDHVSVNDTLCDVETAKSVVELPSPYAGVVLKLHANEGDTLDVGSPLISIGAAALGTESEALGNDSDDELTPDHTEGDTTSAIVASELLADIGLGDPDGGATLDEQPLVLVGTGPKEAGARRVRLRLPKDEAEFIRYRAVGGHDPVRTIAEASGATRIPVRGVRKVTAEAMVRSAFSAPHAAMWITVDVTATMNVVRRLVSDKDWSGTRVSPLLVIAKTVTLAVRRYPEINASWDEAAQEIVLHPTLNLGIAAATPRGLMVPNIKDAGGLTLVELAAAMDEVISRARDGKLSPAEMSGGTLTITNVGTLGMEGATPIINPPEAAILALGAIQPRPWVVDGRVKVRDVMTISISIDHRLVDGELGANVLRYVGALLNDPARALL